jgi:hypothetical protein
MNLDQVPTGAQVFVDSLIDEITHVRNFLAMFLLAIPNAKVFSTFFDLRARFSLSHWDAPLLAACKEAGVGHGRQGDQSWQTAVSWLDTEPFQKSPQVS